MIQNFVSKHSSQGCLRDIPFLESLSPIYVANTAGPNYIGCQLANEVIAADTALYSYVQFADPAQFSEYAFSAGVSLVSNGIAWNAHIFRATVPKGAPVSGNNLFSLADTVTFYALDCSCIFAGVSCKDVVSFNPFELDDSASIDVYWGVFLQTAVSGAGPFAVNGSIEGHCVTVDRSVYQPNK